MKKKSEALKRVPLPCLEELLDEVMNLVPQQTVDFSDAGKRDQLRSWMRMICGRAIKDCVDAFSTATTNAIDEAGALFIDPDYYESRKKRRHQQKLNREAKQKAEETKAAPPKKPSLPDKPYLM